MYTKMNRNKKLQVITFIADCAMEFLEDSNSDGSDSEDDIVMFITELKTGNFMKTKPLRIHLYLENVILRYNTVEFQSHFRMTKVCFEALMRLLGPLLKRRGRVGRKTINPDKQVLAVLWLLATPDSFRSVGDRFDMAKSTLASVVSRVVRSVNSLSKIIIKWPVREEMPLIQRNFCEIAGVPYVIGAVDGTYIPIKAPSSDPEVYITRKCHYAITLQAISIFSLKFIDVFVGYPGSVSDTRIFKKSDIFKNIQLNKENYVPHNTIILGDKAYPTLEWCIPPFIDRGNLTAEQKRFNKKHAQTRQVIERTFALLFGRYRRLKFLDMNKFEMIPHVVLAACILHNLCIDHSNLEFIEEYIAEGEVHIEGNDNPENEELPDVDLDVGRVRRNVLFNEIFN